MKKRSPPRPDIKGRATCGRCKTSVPKAQAYWSRQKQMILCGACRRELSEKKQVEIWR